MDYDTETRNAYRSEGRAAAYKRRQTRQWSWMRLATWRQQALISRLADQLRLGPGRVVLDAPCGTGILGPVVNALGCDVIAADISAAMMSLARPEYNARTFRGFLQADLLQLPLAPKSVDTVITLGFLHRVPAEIRRAALSELAFASRGPLVATCSIDSFAQRVKGRLLSAVKPDYLPAPHRAKLADLVADCEAAGLRVVAVHRPLPLLSANAVIVLDHRADRVA